MPGQPCHSWWLWWHHTNLLLSTISPTNGSARMCNVHSGLMNCDQVVMFISWGEMPMQPVTKNFDNIICWSAVRYNYRMMKLFETCCVCTCLDLYTFMVVCVCVLMPLWRQNWAKATWNQWCFLMSLSMHAYTSCMSPWHSCPFTLDPTTCMCLFNQWAIGS